MERQRFFGVLDWYDRNVDLIVKIQALWRGRMARRKVTLKITLTNNRAYSIIQHIFHIIIMLHYILE